jgi:hypothetical protein
MLFVDPSLYPKPQETDKIIPVPIISQNALLSLSSENYRGPTTDPI